MKALAEIVPGLIDPATGKIAANAPTNHHFDAASEDTVDKSPVAGLEQNVKNTHTNTHVHSHAKPQQKVQSNDNLPTTPAVDGYISSSSSEKSTPTPQQNVYNKNMRAPTSASKNTNNYKHHPSSSSVATISTHEIRLPMYLPTFKPATGCTNASDFIVRCFAARLRAGITVVKHGRSRWCKSRLRILHVHSDGRSLTWKPAPGEPSSKSKPPKLDLSTCTEVRHGKLH